VRQSHNNIWFSACLSCRGRCSSMYECIKVTESRIGEIKNVICVYAWAGVSYIWLLMQKRDSFADRVL